MNLNRIFTSMNRMEQQNEEQNTAKLHCMLSDFSTQVFSRNARLDKAQAGIKIARRNINNLRYTDDTTLMVESKEELNSLLMKAKEKSEKVSLKLSIQKTKIMASGPIISWQIDGGQWKL